MEVRSTAIPDVKLILPRKFQDDRGFFSETYSRKALEETGVAAPFVQDNHSFSAARGTVRGLHFQIPPHAQGKLVRVAKGAILDVAVDIRQGSPTYGRHLAVALSAENWMQLWIPEGFAHGFWTLEPGTEVIYKVTCYYSAACDRGIRFDDPDLGIPWPGPVEQATLSEKDRSLDPFATQPAWFTYAPTP